MLDFVKMNGAGNDFVMLDNRQGSLTLSREQIARICDRHRGVGADGVLIVEPAQNGADFRMRYYNADGGEAEMCGNGARCFARYAGRFLPGQNTIRFETLAGLITAELLGERVRLDMSRPHSHATPVTLEGHEVHFINTGVPHAVIFVEDLDNFPVVPTGRMIRQHSHFAPAGTNVNFVQASGNSLAIRTYERGVEDETLACGTGVVASALIHHSLTGHPSPIAVRVRGGDILEVGFQKQGNDFENVTLTGPAEFVFEGQIPIT